ncbi:MAG: c-type cytochrome, partial [Oricola sp.]|nr:c-type cytochrome [Oricola sp.]
PALHLERMTAGQPEVEKGGFLKAWDVANRKLKWKVPLATTWNSGTLTTASNLVIHASGDGYFSAYDAETGERLLHLFTGNSAMAAPVTYMIDGVQYVALLAGYGGSGMITVGDDAALKTYENTGRLLVFKLGGGDVPAPDKRETPLGPAPQSASLPPLGEDKLAAASQLYLKCAGCHSTGGGTPMLPNLSRVPELGQETFRSILLEGALVPKGMPHFGDELTQEDADLLYEYISRGRHNVPVENARWY